MPERQASSTIVSSAGTHSNQSCSRFNAAAVPSISRARVFGSPLGVWDFVKYTSVLELQADALHAQAEAIVALARAEGLEGHARAVERRLARGDV